MSAMFNDDEPDDPQVQLLNKWVDLLRDAERRYAVVSVRLTGGSLHVGRVDSVGPVTVVLDAQKDEEAYSDHIALRHIAAVSIPK
jgi:hypothetical protein